MRVAVVLACSILLLCSPSAKAQSREQLIDRIERLFDRNGLSRDPDRNGKGYWTTQRSITISSDGDVAWSQSTTLTDPYGRIVQIENRKLEFNIRDIDPNSVSPSELSVYFACKNKKRCAHSQFLSSLVDGRDRTELDEQDSYGWLKLKPSSTTHKELAGLFRRLLQSR